jgi:RNA polymerase sigma-70 factor (ECF subfamily)
VSVEELVQASLRERDLRGAATKAIQGFGPSIVRYLRTTLRDPEDVSDAFSDWAESLWAGIGSFEGRSSFRTWAFRLAFTSMLSMLDRAHRRRERRFATGEASILAAEVRTTALSLERRRLRLDELRAELAPEEQTLLFLRVGQGLPWQEVAAVLTTEAAPVDPAAARKRFERLKEKLRKLARDRGLVQ